MQFPALARFGFAPPTSLTMPAAGLDISGGSAKFVQLGQSHSSLNLQGFGEVPLAEGVLVAGEIENPDAVAEILRSFRLKHHIRYANTSLSEKKAFLYQVLVPHDVRSLREAVEFDLEAHVPLPPAETLFDFEVARDTREGRIVAVTAYARRIIETYESVFQKAGVVLRSLEVESHAIARAVLGVKGRGQVVLVVDMGKKTTRIAVADHGAVSYTATMDLGGNMLTEALMKRFSIDAAAADAMKNEKGFLRGKDNTDVVEAVAGSVSVLKDELAKHIQYWNSPTPDDVPREKVERVIISGGNANLIGLAEYLSDSLGLSVHAAHVWRNAFSINHYIPPMQAAQSLEYAPAIGLALKSAFNQSW